MAGASAGRLVYPPLGTRVLRVRIDLSAAAWNTVGTHRVFVPSGLVRAHVMYYCTENLVGGAGATISFGTSNAGAAAWCAAQLITNFSIGQFAGWGGGTVSPEQRASTTIAFPGNNQGDWFYGTAIRIGYELAVNPATDGTLIAIAHWMPFSEGANLAAGAGSAF